MPSFEVGDLISTVYGGAEVVGVRENEDEDDRIEVGLLEAGVVVWADADSVTRLSK